MVNCPLPTVADMLMAIGPGDDEATVMFDFIKSHYTRAQIRGGIDEYQKRVDSIESMFGGDDGSQE